MAVATVPRNLVVVVIALVGIATIFAKALFGRPRVAAAGRCGFGARRAGLCGRDLDRAAESRPLVVALLAYFLALLVSQSRVEGGIHSLREVVYGGVLGLVVSGTVFLLCQA